MSVRVCVYVCDSTVETKNEPFYLNPICKYEYFPDLVYSFVRKFIFNLKATSKILMVVVYVLYNDSQNPNIAAIGFCFIVTDFVRSTNTHFPMQW